MSSIRQKLLATVNWYLQSSLKHITWLFTDSNFYHRGGRYRQVSLYDDNTEVDFLLGTYLDLQKYVINILNHHDDVFKWKHFRVTGLLCGELSSDRPVTQSFDVFFDLRLNKRMSKQSWGRWCETPWTFPTA